MFRLLDKAVRHLSIKGKLMLIIFGVSTVAQLLLSGAFVIYELSAFRESMTHDLESVADLVGSQSTAALNFDDEVNAQEILKALRARPHIAGAVLFKRGKVFARYAHESAPPGTLPTQPEPAGARFESNHLVLFRPIADPGTGETLGTVYLSSDLLEFHERLVRYTEIVLLFVLSSTVLTFFLSSLLQRIISQPIFELAATARAVTLGRNYSLRAARRGGDELGQLIEGFNEMLSQIQERDAALQQAHDKLEKRVEERTCALQAEVAERQRAQDGLQQQFTRISLLNQITHVISERQDLTRIQNAVLRQLEEHLPVDLGLVCLYLADADQLLVSAVRERHPKQGRKTELAAANTLPLVESGLGLCKNGNTVYLASAGSAQGTLPHRLATAGLNCAVAAPLMVEDKLFGILLVARPEPDSFSSGECEFLRMLGEQVALAAHQAQLHNQLQNAYNELRQTQLAVMQQDRLRALGQMASGIAHDINNALSPVVGFAQMLLEYEKNLSPNARKQLQYIRLAGEDIAHIVARLRDFYRRRDGQEPLLPLDLNRLVEQVVDMTRPRWRDMPQSRSLMIEMETRLQPGLPTLLGTESELREALTNLILNAVDAMPQGGKVLISTSMPGAERGGEKKNSYVMLEVTDSGVGMDEETKRRCLEPFFSTKGRRGTGMGLPMVYGVVERHEGSIEIISELGKGTTVRMCLPLQPSAGVAAQPQPQSSPAMPLHILCIDDEPLLRELVKGMLESDGHTVEVADSGREGVETFRAALQSRQFDVVITDLGMPFLDGRQVARILKNESPATPVLMLTGWGAFMKADGDLPADVDGVLSKPPRSKELRAALTQVTANHSRRS